MTEPRCCFCEGEVDLTDPSLYHEQTGWAQRRKRGLHALYLRKHTGLVAHKICLDRHTRGALETEEMFERP